MLSSRTRDTLPQAAVALAIVAAAIVLLTRIAHAAQAPAAAGPPPGIDWTFWFAVGAAVLGGLSVVLHVVAPRTKNTVDDEIRDDVDKLLAFMRNQSPQDIAAPRNTQAGSSFLGVLAALTIGGVIAAVIACTTGQARQTASAGVVAALDCEAAHLDAQMLADAKVLAAAEVQRWIGGGKAASTDAIKADLAPIKSDLGRCAIAAALAAATVLVSPTPGTAVSALSVGDPVAARAAFSVAARVLGWAPVKLADGTVL